MTPDIERMAREAGLEGDYIAPKDSLAWEALERFAALVRAQERDDVAEKAAQIVERINGWLGTREVAEQIRALKG